MASTTATTHGDVALSSASTSTSTSTSTATNSATSGVSNAATTTPNFMKGKYVAFWDSDGSGLDSWIGKIAGPFQNNGTFSVTDVGNKTTTSQGTYVGVIQKQLPLYKN